MLSTLLPAATPGQLAEAARFARVMRNVRAAQATNPRNAGPYPGAVTITDAGGALPAQTPQSYLMNSVNSGNLGVWHLVGGRTANGGSNNVKSATIDSTGTLGYSYARIEAMVHSRYLAFRVNATTVAHRVLVDGRYVSAAGITTAVTSGTANQYLLLDFGSRAIRRVAIETQQNAALIGGYVEATGKMWPVDLSDAVHGVFLGDSYVVGAGPAARGDGVAVHLGDWLGLHMLASGSGGTGWNQANQGAGGTIIYRFDQRIAQGDLGLGYAAPDIVFLMASLNDRSSDAAPVTANALAGLRTARAQYPGVPIIVFGALPGANAIAGIVQAETAVQAAVTAFADRLCAFVPTSTDPAGAWISGAGKVGATTGSGNSDWATVADGSHPTEEGAAMIGRRYADGAIRALKTLYPVPG